jgi:CubicO group peptidase (beta-lactamase class C family)
MRSAESRRRPAPIADQGSAGVRGTVLSNPPRTVQLSGRHSQRTQALGRVRSGCAEIGGRLLSGGLCFLLLAAIGLAGFPAAAQMPQPAGPHDPAELARFFDGLYARLDRTQHLSGMTVAVVRDGVVLLVRGYGYADIRKRSPVDPEHTLFRIGSITDTFTWTALMQLVGEGRLDVNAPIDQFLTDELDIRSPWGASPTLRDLMTHTPGYEDVPVVGLFRHAPYPGSLRDALIEIQPVIVRQPGTLVSYSNYGSAQAGFVVERVSGVNWESYVESQILKPLGIEDATFAQPLPPALAPRIATGYRWSNGAFMSQGFEYVPLAPAAAGSASAAAMARFMIAHLQDGRYGDARIMPEWTARQMHEPLYRAAPQLGAWLHGFYELRPAGPRVYGHSGSTLWFHSLMALFPETNTGLFFSFNSDTGKLARDQAYDAFLNRYYPQPIPETPAALPGAAARAGSCAGWFVSTRVPRRTQARICALGEMVSIVPEGPGRLGLSGQEFQDPIHLVETEPWVYREVRGQETLVFRSPANDKPKLAFLSSHPGAAYERITFVQSPPFQLAIGGLASLGILLALLGYPVALLSARALHRHVDIEIRAAHVASWAAAAAFTGAIIAFAIFFQDARQIIFGLPDSLVLVQWFGRVGSVLAVVSAASAAMLWARSFGSLGGRIGHTLAALCQFTLALWSAHWGLLG